MKKDECEARLKPLMHDWFAQTGAPLDSKSEADFGAFHRWALDNGWRHLFDFKSTMGPLEDAERWFAKEMGQSWKY